MTKITNGYNVNTPLLVDDYGYVDITTDDFDPITTLTDWKYPLGTMHISRRGMYIRKGFLARPNADGFVYAITYRQYHEVGGSFQDRQGVDLVPQPFLGVANQWIECPLVKVFAQDTASGTECDALNIGLIL
jgi:hypothetical protein